MKFEGTILKGIGGFYYVETEIGISECRARGKFRRENISPLVGDKVIVDIVESSNQGYILEILTRKNQMIRPAIANIDQVIIIFAAVKPDINLQMLQKFIVYAEHLDIKPVLVINKVDLDPEKKYWEILKVFKAAGYEVIETSATEELGIEIICETLKNKISVFAGPSGAGKSTLLNRIKPGLQLKTGDLSKKIDRGTHTTRHAELIELDTGGRVADTPGFTSLDLNELQVDELKNCFPEFIKLSKDCRFNSCSHLKEPDCAVKKAVEAGELEKFRYDFYVYIQEEKKNFRRYK